MGPDLVKAEAKQKTPAAWMAAGVIFTRFEQA